MKQGAKKGGGQKHQGVRQHSTAGKEERQQAAPRKATVARSRNKNEEIGPKNRKGSGEGRKLASGHGRAKAKSGGEPQKKSGAPRGQVRRSGSSQKRKG